MTSSNNLPPPSSPSSLLPPPPKLTPLSTEVSTTVTSRSPQARDSTMTMATTTSTTTTNHIARLSTKDKKQSFVRKRREVDYSTTQLAGNKAAGQQEQAVTISIETEEEEARKKAAANNWAIVVFVYNFAAAIKVFVTYLVTIDTIVCNALTVGMTVYWWEAKENNNSWHGAMSFVLVSFAVAMPIASSIRMAFDRREKALLCMANVRSFALHIYYAHALWDWKGVDGRATAATEKRFDFENHCDQVLEHLIGIGDEMSRFLSLPTFSLPRHRVLRHGKAEAAQSLKVAYHLLDSTLLQHMTRLTVLAERLKAIGLSGSEISRIRQYERHFSYQLEQLRMYKVYRTPQALWAFGRIFTLLLPPFYAPTFTEVARELGHLWLGVIFAMITATCLTALFESVQILEDPFTAFVTLDGIDVTEELEVLQWTQLVNARKLLFPQSPDYQLQRKPAIAMNSYDPSVHYHSTPELRATLSGGGSMFGSMAIKPGAYNSTVIPAEDTIDDAPPPPVADVYV